MKRALGMLAACAAIALAVAAWPDHDGSRHQRFILRLASGQTLLVAHNTGLARRIPGLGKGNAVGFHGEYEWSRQGGVIHWTPTWTPSHRCIG